jgi:hypothetical protein
MPAIMAHVPAGRYAPTALRPHDPAPQPPLRPQIFALEGFFTDAFSTLTTGAVLAGFALSLEAGPIAMSLLWGLPYLAQLGQLAVPLLERRLPSRKSYMVPAVVFGRLLWLVPTGLVAAGLHGTGALVAAMAAVLCMAFLNMLGQNGVSAWLAEIVPSEQRPRTFAPRHRAAAAATLVLSPLVALVLDRFDAPDSRPLAFGAIGVTTALLGAAGGLTLLRWPELPRATTGPDPSPGPTYLAQVREVAREPGFRRWLMFCVAWNFNIGLPLAFWQVFMQQRLGMSFLAISGLVVIQLSVRMASTRFWAERIARHGARRILAACALALCIMPIEWCFVRPDFLAIVFWDSVLSGFLWSGFLQAFFILPMELLPEPRRSLGLGLAAFAGGATLFVATLLGGAFMRAVGTESLDGFRVLFATAAVLRIGSGRLAFRLFSPDSTPRGVFRAIGAALRPGRPAGASR